MSLQGAIDAIEAAKHQHREELSKRDRRIEELSKEASHLGAELSQVKTKAQNERQRAEQAKAELVRAEQKIIDAHASVAHQVATLEAEKEMLAERDRTARAELERLRMSKK